GRAVEQLAGLPAGAAGPGHLRGGSGRLVLGGELGVLEHRGAAGPGARLRGDLVRAPREDPGTGAALRRVAPAGRPGPAGPDRPSTSRRGRGGGTTTLAGRRPGHAPERTGRGPAHVA